MKTTFMKIMEKSKKPREIFMHCMFPTNMGGVFTVLQKEDNAYILLQNLSQKIEDKFHVN